MKRTRIPEVVKSYVFTGTNGINVAVAYVFKDVVGVTDDPLERDEWSYGRCEVLIDQASFAAATANGSQLVIDLDVEAYVKTLEAATLVLMENETMVWIETECVA